MSSQIQTDIATLAKRYLPNLDAERRKKAGSLLMELRYWLEDIPMRDVRKNQFRAKVKQHVGLYISECEKEQQDLTGEDIDLADFGAYLISLFRDEEPPTRPEPDLRTSADIDRAPSYERKRDQLQCSHSHMIGNDYLRCPECGITRRERTLKPIAPPPPRATMHNNDFLAHVRRWSGSQWYRTFLDVFHNEGEAATIAKYNHQFPSYAYTPKKDN